MRTRIEKRPLNELDRLCIMVREMVADGALDGCIKLICEAMEHNPGAPQPHNLLGIVLAKKGDYLAAMKHFRAAWALDPTYKPATHNLNTYGTFFSRGKCAFDESDLPPAAPSDAHIFYDDRGIGRVFGKGTCEDNRKDRKDRMGRNQV